MFCARLDSSTKVSGQTAFIKSSFKTTCSLLRTSTKRVSKAFSCKGTCWLSRNRTRLPESSRKAPNSYNSFPWLLITRLINF
jgi:hypothetical protein